jgi:hypothetical protein
MKMLKKAGPDLGYPRVLAGGVCFPYGHDVLVIATAGTLLLDPLGLGLKDFMRAMVSECFTISPQLDR